MIFFLFSDNNKNKEKHLNHSLIDLMILWIYLIWIQNSIHRHNFEFAWAVRSENFLYVSRGGVLFIYIYPNGWFIESLQLMFDPEEKEEIFGKWVFMIR